MIESGLFQLITANAAFAALAETRLYPLALPESLIVPSGTPASATYQVISTVPDYTNDGKSGLEKARIRYTGIASTYESAAATAEAVRGVLENFNGSLADGTVVSNILVVNKSSSYSSESRLFFMAYDLMVFYAN